jgi:phage terminase small subunit
MTPKQARFVAEYLIDLNATQAAIRAGYSPKVANRQGSENLSKPDIAAAVQAGQRTQLEAAGVSKARLLQELGRIALSQVADYFDPVTKDAKHPADLSPDAGAALAGFEVLIKNAAAGDGVTDTIHKFKLWDKVKAIELYMKHYGMLIEKVEVTDAGVEARVARLEAARKRAG